MKKQQIDPRKTAYFEELETMSLSDFRKRPLKRITKSLFLCNSLTKSLETYIRTKALVGEPGDHRFILAPAIDIDLVSLIRFIVTAKGFVAHKSLAYRQASKIYACMNRADEPTRVYQFETKSPFFIRYTNDEVILALISGMISMQIPIHGYFDGNDLTGRCLFNEKDWLRYDDLMSNHVEISRLRRGLQPGDGVN